VDRVEEVIEPLRDDEGPDRRGFDELRRRLIDQGIEEQMNGDAE
jgi:exosome complex RNA-binding protein Rrp42 (RNase PH superfamily)